MSLRHWLICKINYELDVKGVAVALAVLVGVSVFSGNRDRQSLQENRQSHDSSVSAESTTGKEILETPPPSYSPVKPSPGLDVSAAAQGAFRHVAIPVTGAEIIKGR